MNPLAVVISLLGLVVLSTALGLVWRATTGRVRGAEGGRTIVRLSELRPDAPTGQAATLLQFSTEVCAPCANAHRTLEAVAGEFEAVRHVDVDVTARPDIARRFGLLQSPTILILDARGTVMARIGGLPRAAEVRAELDRILGAA